MHWKRAAVSESTLVKLVALLAVMLLPACVYVLPPPPRQASKPPTAYVPPADPAELENLAPLTEEAEPRRDDPYRRNFQPEVRPDVQQEPIPDLAPSN